MIQKVFISGKIPRVAYEMLSSEFDVTMHDEVSLLSKKEIIEGLKGKDALLCLLSDKIDGEIIKSNPNLKIIANYGAGFNNIDIKTATEKRIPVTNTPLASTNATSDLTMGLIIAIARRIVEGDKATRKGKFSGWAPLYHLGVEVTGKTLGIIGMGSIGRAVAKRASGFDMNIIYYSRSRLDEEVEKELNLQYMSLDDVVRKSDFLSLHLSYSPEVFHMIDGNKLKMMKPSAYLINAARGPLVDEKALLRALKEGIIKGAALDVYENEPEVTSGFEDLDNVILTPHIGNATIETRGEMAKIAARNIISYLKGGKPETCINPEVLGE